MACMQKGDMSELNGNRRSTYFCTKRAKCCVAPRHQIRPWPFATTYCFSFPGNLQRHRWKISFLSIFNSTAWSRCVTKTFKPQSLSSPLLQDTPHSLPVCCILRTHHWACPCYSWIDPGWLLHIACCKNIKKHQPLCKSSLSLLSSLGTYSKQRPILLRTTTLVCKARDKLKCFEQHHASATQSHAQVHTGFVNLPHASEGDHLKPAWFSPKRDARFVCLISYSYHWSSLNHGSCLCQSTHNALPSRLGVEVGNNTVSAYFSRVFKCIHVCALFNLVLSLIPASPSDDDCCRKS